MRVGFIGTGVIAAAMVKGLTGQGHQITVSKRNVATATDLAGRFRDVQVAGNADVVAGADIVFLCLMADVAPDILGNLPWRADHQVISVMADLPLAELGLACAPATQIALTIPLSSVATGGSVLPVYPNSAGLTALFGATNTIIPVATERGLNAHFAASALSAPILAMMQAGAVWLGRETDDAKGAEAYVAGVFAGFLRQMAVSGDDYETLLQSLMTEGGLNATLRARLHDAGALDTLTDGLDVLKKRLGL